MKRAEPIWIQEVRAHILSIEIRSRGLKDAHEQAQIRELLTKAEKVSLERDKRLSPTRLKNWWTGIRIEEAWSILHQAELLMVRLAPPKLLEELLESALALSTSLPRTDPARSRLSKLAFEQTTPISKSKKTGGKELQ